MGEGWELQGFELLEEARHVVQAAGYVGSVAPILIEIDVQRAGNVEQAADVLVAGFGHQTGDGIEQCGVVSVLPAALFGDGFDHLGGGAPAFFGGLADVAGGEFVSALGQQLAAGRPVGLSRHAHFTSAGHMVARPEDGGVMLESCHREMIRGIPNGDG